MHLSGLSSFKMSTCGHALLAGFSQAKSDVFVTLDSDSEVLPHTLRHMVSPFIHSPRVGAVAGNVRVLNLAQGLIPKLLDVSFTMAAVAREFRLPTIVGCGVATQQLATGDEITVDATQNVVYRGLIKELRYFELTEEAVYEDSYEYRLLRRLLKKITPLNLVDPHAPDFTPTS